FQADARIHSPSAALPDEVVNEFLGLVLEVLHYVDPDTIRTYRVAPVARQIRETVLRLREPHQEVNQVHFWHVDKEQRLASLKYYWAGTEPEVVLSRGRGPISPVFTKDRAVEYFGRTLMHERISWYPARGRLGA